MTHPDTLPSSVTETPETDSDRVSEERLRGAARDLLGALQKYGFPVSDAATRQLMDGGSLEAQAVHVAAKGLAIALRTTPSLPPRSGGVEMARDDLRRVLEGPIGNTDLRLTLQAICLRLTNALADPIPEATADEEVERGWLIELKPSVARQPTWFHLDDEWTTDSTKALRFARKADAEAFIAHSGWTEAFASEHMWGLPASRAALRRSTETDKPGVREAALEEAAKVAASFGDPVCNPFTFTRHAHAQEVATAIRALSASPAPEEQVTDVEADRRERALKVDPDKHGHRTRFSDSSYFDEVCIMCGATDGFGDKRLDQPCPSPLHHGRRDQ